jgi:hypothetical protein
VLLTSKCDVTVMNLLRDFDWKRDWSIVSGAISLIVLGVLIIGGTETSTSEYIPQFDDIVNYNRLLDDFGGGQTAPLILLIIAAGTLSASIFSALRSSVAQTRTVALVIVFFALAGASIMCVNVFTSANFTGNATTLRHLDRIAFADRFYTVAAMETRQGEPYVRRNSVVLFECEDEAETRCRPIHTQFVGFDLDDFPDTRLVFEESGEGLYLEVDNQVAYLVGATDSLPLPSTLPVITTENVDSLTEIRELRGTGYALDWSIDSDLLVVGGASAVWTHEFNADAILSGVVRLEANGLIEQVTVGDDDRIAALVPFNERNRVGSVHLFDRDDADRQQVWTFTYADAGAINESGLVMANGRDVDVRVRATTNGNVLSSLDVDPTQPVYALALSPDGVLLAMAGPTEVIDPEVADEDAPPGFDEVVPGYFRLWNVENEQETLFVEMLGEFSIIGALTFSDDGRYVAYTRQNDLGDTTVVVWNVAELEELATLTTFGSGSFVDRGALAFSGEGSLLATGDQNGTLRVWDIVNSERLVQIETGEGINAVAFSPDNTMVALALDGGTVRLWGVE